MKILKEQEAEIWVQEPGLQGVFEQIEKAARVCYQSHDLIKEGSYEHIVTALIKNKHTAMLEHGTIYLQFNEKNTDETTFNHLVNKYAQNNFSIVYLDEDIREADVTTNYRVIYEQGWMNDLKYLCEPTKYHEKRITVCMTTNLQVATEFLRHRLMSFAMESTRYCCYDKEKFGNDITFILPPWLKNASKEDCIEWANAMQDAENHYMRMRAKGWKAEQAAQVLPKATKTTLVMTGMESFWNMLFDLRYFEKTGPAHPQAKELASIIYKLIHNDEKLE